LMPIHVDDREQFATYDADRPPGLGGHNHRPARRI